MTNMLLLVLAVFAGVALMVAITGRFGEPMEPEKLQRISRWIYPLVGVLLVLSLLSYFFF